MFEGFCVPAGGAGTSDNFFYLWPSLAVWRRGGPPPAPLKSLSKMPFLFLGFRPSPQLHRKACWGKGCGVRTKGGGSGAPPEKERARPKRSMLALRKALSENTNTNTSFQKLVIKMARLGKKKNQISIKHLKFLVVHNGEEKLAFLNSKNPWGGGQSRLPGGGWGRRFPTSLPYPFLDGGGRGNISPNAQTLSLCRALGRIQYPPQSIYRKKGTETQHLYQCFVHFTSPLPGAPGGVLSHLAYGICPSFGVGHNLALGILLG